VSKAYKLKILIGGAPSYGKDAFLNKDYVSENEIGVSFDAIECMVNEEDSYKLVLWELNPKDIFHFMYPNFCRGGRAALLFFDLGDYNSFKNLSYWINMFRENTIKETSGDLPIILLGTEPEFGDSVIFDEEIRALIEEYELNEVFFTISRQDDIIIKKEEMFKYLIKQIDLKCDIHDFSILLPMDDENFLDFLELFSDCPICKGKNHISFLSKFYYSTDQETIALKMQLINLIEQTYILSMNRRRKLNINIGIPCCKCFKQYNAH
jgi:hypothetical protein